MEVVYDDDSDPNNITPDDDANDNLVSIIEGIFIVSSIVIILHLSIYELFGLFT